MQSALLQRKPHLVSQNARLSTRVPVTRGYRKERHAAGSILRETSHLNREQERWVGGVAPEMGLETLSQLDPRKGVFQAQRWTQCTWYGFWSQTALLANPISSNYSYDYFERGTELFSSFVKHLAELNEKKITRHPHNKNSWHLLRTYCVSYMDYYF